MYLEKINLKSLSQELMDPSICWVNWPMTWSPASSAPVSCDRMEGYKKLDSFVWFMYIWDGLCVPEFKIPEYVGEFRKCKEWEFLAAENNNIICCPEDLYYLVFLQRFLDKKWISYSEFEEEINKLNENTQEYLLWKIIEKEEKAEAIYWKIYREFKIVKPYELLPENQTTIFIFLFFILLIFLKSFRKYFLKKG